MRFSLKLATRLAFQRLTLNYQYPLSAAIYKIIHRADADYASFLHNHGYSYGNKSFKFFTFSDLRTPFDRVGDRMILTTKNASVTICFHVPAAAENFIKGLFMNQQLDIADSMDKASFIVEQVTAENLPVIMDYEPLILQPISPVVVGRKNERGNYDYVSPEENDFSGLLINNLLDKYAALNDVDESTLSDMKQAIKAEPVFFRQPPRSRLIEIKEGTDAATKVRGFDKFRLRIRAPAPVIMMALDAGIGMHNALGMGCVEIIEKQ